MTPLWPDGFEGCWTWGQELSEKDNHLLIATNTKGKWKIFRKSYATNSDGENVKKKPFTIWQDPLFYTEKGQIVFGSIFTGLNKNDFPQPKSVDLVKEILLTATESNDIILDSFAGSGTTAHAVLNLNKQDDGTRKFILIEMEDYAETITAERVKRVINGYADKEGTGGSFNYYELGQPLFIGDNSEYINESVGIEKIRQYIWYSETRTAYTSPDKKTKNPSYLGKKDETAYYFIYKKDELTTLDYETLATIEIKAGQYVLYADNCLLPREFMLKNNIVFKKIPRDITRF
ncbi:MAG: DNA methyltransferase [Ferruginibacter sp.]